jgi:SAM-dependent methyltransferase
MAITGIEYNLFRLLREQNVIPLGSEVLELGEANWYGDVDVRVLAQDVYRFMPEASRQETFRRLDEIVNAKRPSILFELAKIFWQTFLQPRAITAIDFHGTEQALKIDLNNPIDLGRQFQVILNLGTAEHVFNVAQVFKTVHDHTAPDGVMIHGLPFSGWVDHGFFNFNPTFYWDLAAANGYAVLGAAYAELKPLKLIQLHGRESIIDMVKQDQIGTNSLIYVVLRKSRQESGFCIPFQGYYANAVSKESAEAWKTFR